MKRRSLLVFLAFVMALALCCPQAFAQENNASGRVSFSVKAHLPENQIDKQLSYYDLRVVPGQSQILQVQVYNNSSEALTVDIALNTASTNPGGVLDYSRPDIRDESMKIAVSDLAYIHEPTLTIPPNDSRAALVGITMPDEQFDGVLLGGIQIKQSIDENAAESAEGVGVINEYAYVIAVKLTETDTPVAPELHLKKIVPELVNYKTAVVATIQNSEASIIKGLDINAQVFEAGSSTPLRESAKSDVDMAPNSVFEYAIDWENTRIKPGSYTLHMTATAGDKTWEWTEPFNIEGVAAGEVNSGAIDLAEGSWLTGTVMYIAASAAAVLLIAAIIWFAARRRRRYAN